MQGMMRVFRLCFSVALCVFAASTGKGEAAPTSYACKYAVQSPNYRPDLIYPCPVPTPIPSGVTQGYNAYRFLDSVGFNIHLDYTNTIYGNYPYVKAALQALGIKHVRSAGVVDLATPLILGEINDLYTSSGIKSDLLVEPSDTLSEANANLPLATPGAVDFIEGPNELETAGGGSTWAATDDSVVETIMHPAALQYNQNYKQNVKVIAPSLVAFEAENGMGDLTPWVDYGNGHDYTGGNIPENTGYGGVGNCNQPYGTSVYAICDDYGEATGRLLISTESGECTLLDNPGCIDEVSQGSYLIRQLLDHLIHGWARYYIYDLFNEIPVGGVFGSTDDYWGLVNNDGSQKLSFPMMAGFFAIMADTPHSDTCNVPVALLTPSPTSTAPPIRSVGFCKANGEYDLVAFQTVASYDQEAFVYYNNPIVNYPLVYKSGFTPTSVHLWSTDSNGVWSVNASPSPGVMPLNDRPAVMVFNRPSPVALPTLPTPPPTPTPPPATPTPAPTPTPVPTSTPTAVTIKSSGSYLNNGGASVVWTYPSPAPSHAPNASYGDYILGIFNASYYQAPRGVTVAPAGFNPVTGPVIFPAWPGSPGGTKLSYQSAYNTFNYQSYAKYIYAQGGEPNPDNWIVGGGSQSTSLWYDFAGVDSSNPIGAEAIANQQYADPTTIVHAYCPNLTVPRPGSQVILFLAAAFGGGSTLLYSGVPSGWSIDQDLIPNSYAAVWEFHLNALTTTANQVVTGPTIGFGQYYNPVQCEMLAIQPPA